MWWWKISEVDPCPPFEGLGVALGGFQGVEQNVAHGTLHSKAAQFTREELKSVDSSSTTKPNLPKVNCSSITRNNDINQ